MKPELSSGTSAGNGPTDWPCSTRQRQALEHQHAGQRDDEGRDLEVGDAIALRRADQRRRATQADDRRPERSASRSCTISTAASAPMKPRDRADRQVDVAGDDHQQHAQRHDDDVAVLQHQVGEVERLQQRAVGHELEEHHDRDQRQQHAVLAQIVLEEARMLRRAAAAGLRS